MSDKEVVKLEKEIIRLKSELKSLKKNKKFGLVWEEREREHGIDDGGGYYPFLVKKGQDFNIENGDNNKNILIEGDNYHALEILNYTHKEKIDVIYIDPPYNKGKDFKYGDKWIDKEDGYKHSYWLSFMSKRLKLAKTLLRDSGVIFISIDDIEHARLKLLCDDIFGTSNFIGNITWEKRTKSQNTKTAKDLLQSKTEYILAYKKSSNKIRFNLEKNGVKTYDLVDKKGKYRLKVVEEMSALGMRSRATMVFEIEGIAPKLNNQWKIGKDEVLKYKERGDLEIIEGKPFFKVRPTDEDNIKTLPFWSHFFSKEIGTAESGKSELSDILGTKKHGFETVKPITLIKKLITHVKTNTKYPIVLDFFAGSGTTGHAVMKLFEDKNIDIEPQYILVTNNENNICEEITYPRLKKVINGYTIKKLKKNIEVTPINSNLEYLKIQTLFHDDKRYSELDIKEFMVDKCKEIIKVKESCFELQTTMSDFLLHFNKSDKDVYILQNIYDMSPRDYIEAKELINKADGDVVILYILALQNQEHYRRKFQDSKKQIIFEPLPENFLKVLRHFYLLIFQK